MRSLYLLLGLAGLAVAAPSCPSGGGKSVPSPQSVKSDLTILTHNDLLGNASTRSDSVIVLNSPFTSQQASTACSKLHEALFNPSGNVDFLTYLSFQGKPGPYWTSGDVNQTCTSIHPSGEQGPADCSTRLPALCTNRAPLSNLTYSDNSTTFQTTVHAPSGKRYTGYRDKHSFRFLGIRYAAQPVRFTYSEPDNAAGTFSALDFGSQCIQGAGDNVAGSEDCLFLNIWAPSLPAASNESSCDTLKPILFWIHGGAFTGGTSSDPTFDGGDMASRGDVVVIAINYRLGNFGFLALPDGTAPGNFGLADQITALDWVHSYARAFGGDPDRITIAGQSAGAASVRALLASPKAIGKFAGAIPQSNLAGQGYATPYSQYYNISAEYETAVVPLLEATGCTNVSSQVSCLRDVDAATLSNTTTARFLVQDGTYLVSDGLQFTGAGSAAHVPVLMGFMRDDGAAFISYPTPNISIPSFVNTSGFTFPDSAAANTLSTLFPTPSSSNTTLNTFNTTSLVSTDAQFRCLDLATAYSASLNNVFPATYFYEFNRSYQTVNYSPNSPVCEAPPTASHPYGDPEKEYFKCHSGELYYTFGTLAFNGLPARDEQDFPFARHVLDSWAAFARTGRPTPGKAFLDARGFASTSEYVRLSGGTWSAVDAEAPRLRLLQAPSQGVEFYAQASREQCEALGLGLDYYERMQA